VGCCWEIWSGRRSSGPQRRAALALGGHRNTYGELTTTTLKTWLDWFPEERFGKVVHGAPITHNLSWDAEDGTKVELEMWFLALDRPEHVKKLLSMEITGALDERGARAAQGDPGRPDRPRGPLSPRRKTAAAAGPA
jgi:hypothetical protein